MEPVRSCNDIQGTIAFVTDHGNVNLFGNVNLWLGMMSRPSPLDTCAEGKKNQVFACPASGVAGKGIAKQNGVQQYLLTSPQAPRVVPMALMTEENTVFRSCLSTPCSWYVCRVVSRRVPFPYCKRIYASVRGNLPLHGPYPSISSLGAQA